MGEVEGGRTREGVGPYSGLKWLVILCLAAATLLEFYAVLRLDRPLSRSLGSSALSLVPGLFPVLIVQSLALGLERRAGSLSAVTSLVCAVVYPVATLGLGLHMVESYVDPAVTGKAWLGVTTVILSVLCGLATVGVGLAMALWTGLWRVTRVRS